MEPLTVMIVVSALLPATGAVTIVEGLSKISSFDLDWTFETQPRVNFRERNVLPTILNRAFENVRSKTATPPTGSIVSKECFGCKVGMGAIKLAIKMDFSDDTISNTIIAICKILQIFDSQVCESFVHVFQEQVLYVMRRVILEPTEICGVLLGEKCGAVTSPIFHWTVPLPSTPKPPVVPVPIPKAGAPVLRVLHITDIHYDPDYVEGANTKCKAPLCCQRRDGPGHDRSSSAGKWGDYHDCDTPLTTLQSMLRHIVANHKIDYIMWTGDVPPHDIWESSREGNLAIVQRVKEILLSYFPNTPIFPAVGNHESVPVNSFPPPEVKGKFDISWLYDNLANMWGHWLPKSTEYTIRKGGYYSVLVNKRFRIISLNSNYCNGFNWWLLLNSTDPANQLSWLVDELQQAELSGEKVHIISHIPPGKSDCIRVWSKNFNNIINRFESTVLGQFYGHTHFDEFEVVYDRSLTRATNMVYITPSVTTYLGVNPSYRIFTVDGDYPESTRAVIDHETFFLNITKANECPESVPQWQKAYSAKELYGLPSLQPEDWRQLVNRMRTNDQLFQTFYRLYSTQSGYNEKVCTGECQLNIICDLKSAINDPSTCQQTT